MNFFKIFKQYPNLCLGLLLFVAGLILYTPTLHNPMFWDDNDFIVNNQFIKDWSLYKNVWTQNVIAGSNLTSNYWRPGLLTVFSIEWHLWGNNPIGFHAVNTLFHAANGVLLFILLYYLFKRKSTAFFTALIFIIHPLQTEAISYVNSLGDALSTFFVLLGLIAIALSVGARTAKQILLISLASVLYILAQVSKETAIIMGPLAVLVLITLYYHTHAKEKVEEILKRILPFFVLASTYLILRAGPLNFKNSFNLYDTQTTFSASILVRMFTFCKVIFIYLGLIFWPANLHMERTVDIITSWRSPWVLAGLLLFMVSASIIWLCRIKAKPVSFGLLWFFICLIPVSNILVPINGILYEHWLYLALSGITLAISYSVFIIWHKFPKLQGPLAIVILIIFLSLAGRTYLRNQDWSNAIRFYKQTLKNNPSSYRIWNNLGMEYANLKQNDLAEDAYQHAIDLDDTNAVALYNLGNLKLAENKYTEAETLWWKALEGDPKFIYAYNQLLYYYQQTGQKEKMIKVYKLWQQVQ